MNREEILIESLKYLQIQQQNIQNLISKLPKALPDALNALLKCEGQVICTAIGKSAFIAQKLAASLSSIGINSKYIHPVDALHGDIGLISSKDLLFCFSKSGETEELLKFVSIAKTRIAGLICITNLSDSTLAKQADFNLSFTVDQEACPLDLIPTTSASMSLILADVLLSLLTKYKGIQAEDFALNHPAGSLGYKLLNQVSDLMHKDKIPYIKLGKTIFPELIEAMTNGRFGLAIVTDQKDKMLGIITDGDLRRAIKKNGNDFLNMKVDDIMNSTPITILAEENLATAEKIMKKHKITSLIVKSNDQVDGVIQVYDIQRKRI